MDGDGSGCTSKSSQHAGPAYTSDLLMVFLLAWRYRWLHRLLAVGRDACTFDLGLEKVGVTYDKSSGKIPVTAEQTNVPSIYAIGDVLESRQVRARVVGS
mgnify:CR=1 FL=1